MSLNYTHAIPVFKSNVQDLVGGKAINLVGGPVLKGVLRQAVNGSSHLKKILPGWKSISIDVSAL